MINWHIHFLTEAMNNIKEINSKIYRKIKKNKDILVEMNSLRKCKWIHEMERKKIIIKFKIIVINSKMKTPVIKSTIFLKIYRYLRWAIVFLIKVHKLYILIKKIIIIFIEKNYPPKLNLKKII